MEYCICAYLLCIVFVISLMVIYWMWRRMVHYRDMLDSKGVELNSLRKSVRSLTLERDMWRSLNGIRFRQVGEGVVSYKNGCKIIDSIYEVF